MKNADFVNQVDFDPVHQAAEDGRSAEKIHGSARPRFDRLSLSEEALSRIKEISLDPAARERTQGPAADEFVPEEKREPLNCCLPDKDADGPDRKDSGAESCTCNTDRVDREIEKLKKTQEALKRQINSETDDTRIEGLEKKLAQVEGELRQKNNDIYRRQHAVFS